MAKIYIGLGAALIGAVSLGIGCWRKKEFAVVAGACFFIVGFGITVISLA